MKRASLMVVGVSTVLLIGAQLGCADRNALANREAWLTSWPPDTPSYEPLDPSIVRLVLEPQETSAEERLSDASWVRITPEEADRLAGWSNAPAGPEGALYLIRGIGMSENVQGGFTVYRLSGDDLLVVFSVMGTAPLQAVRQPLVVWLETRPHRVYVQMHAIR